MRNQTSDYKWEITGNSRNNDLMIIYALEAKRKKYNKEWTKTFAQKIAINSGLRITDDLNGNQGKSCSLFFFLFFDK